MTTTPPTTGGPSPTTMRVIGAGFGRTGTLSLKNALEKLGLGPCYHMTEVFQHPEHAPIWEAAGRGETVDWDNLLAGYQSTVDWPGCSFYKQLMEKYPSAKVLLSVRDPEKWYESVNSTIYSTSQLMNNTPAGIFRRLSVRLFAPNIFKVVRMIHTLVWDQTFHHKFTDKAYTLALFEQHIEEVKSVVPAEQLLVYSVKEGWEPLCTFFNVPIPDEPFPHLNDRDSFNQRRRGRRPVAR